MRWWTILILLAVVRATAGTVMLPPAWADRVVFYHDFDQGLKTPAVNTIDATLRVYDSAPADSALAGTGLTTGNPESKRHIARCQVISPALGIDRPLTAMFWWRLDAEMTETTGFSLLAIHSIGGRHGGYISTFLRGKGTWCALRHPTRIYQLYNFPEITNWNNPWSGRAWYEPGDWHHVAITVSGARQIDFYYDGVHTMSKQAVGRLFVTGDSNAVSFGPTTNGLPMTIDDLVIVNRALSADELAAYVHAVHALHQRPELNTR